MAENDWLTSLVAGSEVMVRSGYVHDSMQLDKVVKVTPTQIVLSGDRRFDRKSGYRKGERGYTYTSLSQATDEAKLVLSARRARNVLRHDIQWSRMTDERVMALAEELKEWINP